MVTGVGQIGCIPYELARYDGNDSRCNEEINNAILLFNSGLKKLVVRFNKVLPGAKFVFLDSFESTKDLVVNAKTYGNYSNTICYSKYQQIHVQTPTTIVLLTSYMQLDVAI